jgi:hypothetical protein
MSSRGWLAHEALVTHLTYTPCSTSWKSLTNTGSLQSNELLTTPFPLKSKNLPKCHTPNVTVFSAPHPSKNNGEPIPANPFGPPEEHAVPSQNGDMVHTPRAPALRHGRRHLLYPRLSYCPRSAKTKAPEPCSATAPPKLYEQLVTTDHDPLSALQPATTSANRKVARGAAAVDKKTRPPTRSLDTNDPLRQTTWKRRHSPETCQDDPWTRWRRLNEGGRGGT